MARPEVDLTTEATTPELRAEAKPEARPGSLERTDISNNRVGGRLVED
jgi:hypothetical protein